MVEYSPQILASEEKATITTTTTSTTTTTRSRMTRFLRSLWRRVELGCNLCCCIPVLFGSALRVELSGRDPP